MTELETKLLDALRSCVQYGAMTGDEWVFEKVLEAIAEAEKCAYNTLHDVKAWITWTGGDPTVEDGSFVDVLYRDGAELHSLEAGKVYPDYIYPRDASYAFWRHDGQPNDIIAYRIVKE